MVDYELGFNADNLLVINNNFSNSETKNSNRVFVENLLSYPGIEKIGFSSYLPGSENGDVGGGFRMEGKKVEESIQLYEETVSGNFFDLMNVDIIEGDGFVIDKNSKSVFSDVEDNKRIVINESAVKQLGFDDNANIIGKNLEIVENEKIVQQWFFGDDEDENPSIVTMKLWEKKSNTPCNKKTYDVIMPP